MMRICQASIVAMLVALGSGCHDLVSARVIGEPTANFPKSWDGKMSEAAEQAIVDEANKAKDHEAFVAAKEADDFDAYLGYLKDFSQGAHREEAAQAATQKAEQFLDEDLRHKAYDMLIDQEPEVLKGMPTDRAVLYIGPVGMKVRDILAMREQGLGDKVISSKISVSQKLFKDFSMAELGALKTLGIPDEIVEAMIQSHAAAEKEQKQKAEKDALRKEIAELRKLVENQAKGGGASGGTASGGPTVQTKDGPMNTAGCIAGRLAALKLCEQIPWPGSTICSSTAEANFPCN